ncbi:MULTISPECIES: hypothetical protein [Acidianus]|jgi:hypothetical protein|uniref:Uncharacterized protein n=4 Tax=Acidianus TaxID=12914 RepID=A0A650CX47_ACIAM|nr:MULTISPECIES: hypothetical protein [Acidianus]MDT7901000.1 hypothetical protein [Acidianus sp.]PVU74207.1 hypothetical protein DDW13_08600 [Acidianus hospitalis]AEE93514.1 conserved hypothetical protein [Acidianus hospitalis W1]MCY0883534.1 hypothetical protein [Acidianus infernus]MQL54615.1 hypothetical protein [Acidianus ambivalens]
MWREVPLTHIILEKLRKLEGPIKDDDLYNDVRKSVDYEVPFGDFLRALMSLEIRGYISVSLIRENSRMITYIGDKE